MAILPGVFCLWNMMALCEIAENSYHSHPASTQLDPSLFNRYLAILLLMLLTELQFTPFTSDDVIIFHTKQY